MVIHTKENVANAQIKKPSLEMTSWGGVLIIVFVLTSKAYAQNSSIVSIFERFSKDSLSICDAAYPNIINSKVASYQRIGGSKKSTVINYKDSSGVIIKQKIKDEGGTLQIFYSRGSEDMSFGILYDCSFKKGDDICYTVPYPKLMRYAMCVRKDSLLLFFVFNPYNLESCNNLVLNTEFSVHLFKVNNQTEYTPIYQILSINNRSVFIDMRLMCAFYLESGWIEKMNSFDPASIKSISTEMKDYNWYIQSLITKQYFLSEIGLN